MTASPTPGPTATAQTVTIIGHRGAAGEAPENTLAAFQKALDDGVRVIELDVHLSKDGRLVVMHDPALTRTTDGSGAIGDRTLAELKQLNAAAQFKGSGDYGVQRIPTLQEVFDLVGSRAAFVIEIKVNAAKTRYPGIEQQVVDVVRRNNAVATTTIGSFDLPTLQEIQRLEPQLRRTAFISTAYFRTTAASWGPAQIAEHLKGSGAQVVSVDRSLLARPLVEALKAAGLSAAVWTVDDPVEMWKFVDMGVDTITTNQPALLLNTYRQGRNTR